MLDTIDVTFNRVTKDDDDMAEFSTIKDATLLKAKPAAVTGFERRAEHMITTDADPKKRLPSQLDCLYSDTSTLVIPKGDNLDPKREACQPFVFENLKVPVNDVRTYYRFTYMRADYDAEMKAEAEAAQKN